MYLTDKYNIKEVLAFPLMRPVKETKTLEAADGEKVEVKALA
jgi:lysyl-tRNA synthetase class 2